MSGELITRRSLRAKVSSVRYDIQGLRAFAVLSVIVFHLWPLRLSGGFVGVDVFFVISGYLIIGHILREVTKTGTVRLGAFWSRRAKRLLPSSLLVLLSVSVATLLIVPSSFWKQYFGDVIASALYSQNWKLAADSVNYLSATDAASPMQHFWSLSVEEQFYIGIPLLIVALIAIRRRFARAGSDPTTAIRVLLVVVIVASFLWCLVQTSSAESIAYFSTATRAWEFALGGLASTFAVVRASADGARVRHLLATILAWVGAGLLVLSLFVITRSTPFPGSAAALPVVGALLVVAFGARSGLQRLGAVRPIAFIGRISYSLYLWHWPLIVLVPFVTGHDLGTRAKLAILVVSFVLASVTTVVLEEPLRFSRLMKTMRPRRVAVVGLVATVVVVSVSAGGLVDLDRQTRDAKAFAASLATGDVDCFGAAALISSPKPCVNPKLREVMTPTLANASSDDDNRRECWGMPHPPSPGLCTFGPKTGYKKHLLAIGDSHNNALMGTYKRIAEKYDWRIDVSGVGGCYWTTATQPAPFYAAAVNCKNWKAAITSLVATEQGLSAIVVTHSTTDLPVNPRPGETRDETTVNGLAEAWSTATNRGIPILAIRDNPRPIPSTVTCVAQTPIAQINKCDVPISQAFATYDGQQDAIARVGLGKFIDLSRYECTPTVCPPVIGGVLVMRDPSHLTATFANSLAPYLGQEMAAALAQLKR